jgi:hypothetical protein
MGPHAGLAVADISGAETEAFTEQLRDPWKQQFKFTVRTLLGVIRVNTGLAEGGPSMRLPQQEFAAACSLPETDLISLVHW